MKKRFSVEQIIGILREQEAAFQSRSWRAATASRSGPFTVEVEVRRHGVSDAKRLRELGSENAKLKRLLAEAHLDNAALKDLLSKN